MDEEGDGPTLHVQVREPGRSKPQVLALTTKSSVVLGKRHKAHPRFHLEEGAKASSSRGGGGLNPSGREKAGKGSYFNPEKADLRAGSAKAP